MAEGVLFNLGKKVLEVVGSLALQEIKLACGVKDELDKLKSTVSTIQAVLLDAEKQGSHNNEVKDWLKKLRDVFLDADDVLDDLSTEALQHKVMTGSKMTKEVRIFFSSSNQLAFSLKMGHRIKAIRERLNVIADDRMKFHFKEIPIESQVMNKDRETHSFVLEEDVVGREDDKNKIINLLLDSNTVENVSIIPIVGIGGLGKTTLAQLIYNDKIVKNNFELKLWICVSDNFDLKHIVKQILESLGNRKDEESLEILQNNLRGKLNGKKYFIVLDDVWNEDRDKWLLLKNLLVGGARGSRILITTRSKNVAKITTTNSPYSLKVLSKEKAWNLFVKMAFVRGQEPTENFSKIGKKIVEKCYGLPLAIRTIGSLLYLKTSETEWQSFLDDELSKLTQEENKISSTLKLSYDHLPSHLKQCFAYCRLFPKDYRINVDTLINLWAAQDFIVLKGPKPCFADIGRKYFMELLSRSFFQDVENHIWGHIESCKMHDLMHDLACLVSGTESVILNSSGENAIEKLRHVSYNLVDSSRQFSIPTPNGRKIRTVLAFGEWRNLGNLTCDALISNFKYLRALDLSNLELLVVPHSIGKLKHLRYLDLSNNWKIKILPNSITKMLNLQTLILQNCSSLRELPRGIKKLVNLKFLDIMGCNQNYKWTNMPLEIEHHTYLETILPWAVVRMESSRAQVKKGCCGSYKKKKAKSNGPSQLKELHNLGSCLMIENLGHGKDEVRECKDANLKEKHHLQRLCIHWDASLWDGETEYYDKMLKELQPHPNLNVLELSCYMGVRIPSWVSSLTNLVQFRLSSNKRLQHLPPLNQRPFLKEVSLWGMEALEYIWIDEESAINVLGASSSSSSKTPFFPSLSSLTIRDCPKLKGWQRNSDDDDDNEPHHLLLPSFPPSLSELCIDGCPDLTSMPPFPYLKEVCPNLTFVPPFPYLKEKLSLRECSWKLLEQTMKMKMKMGAETTSTYFPLSQLQELQLAKINDLESLPKEWLRNLVSLQKLSIESCNGLVSLPWIGSLTSLQSLGIRSCDNLKSLPQEIRNLTSLNVLSIRDCPLLGQRCKRQIGEDWPFIAHVPFIEVDWQNQQEETISSES
nr:putative disease resistance protein RGA1 [Quercus suber]XP_023875885.1 putative disease resistance protein RGA1 [Quercus suber]XP_023875886.1 putative disease resistance protein RGA1 [Quercus suber]XP_023875887.1 putative disease resistance protein RGA1 [Quercus suber]XP_023875888.1 putative disease resistance protein RGA1 [Quercus suber]XP_023875889.1 putative disease resistance protein RGA1 [Quercus suber]XP_023875890.1 putative disease resistance protein RGA1 [Quercus suber]